MLSCFTTQFKDIGDARQTSGYGTGSIPDGAIGIFNWYNTSVRAMALGYTNRNEYQGLSWG